MDSETFAHGHPACSSSTRNQGLGGNRSRPWEKVREVVRLRYRRGRSGRKSIPRLGAGPGPLLSSIPLLSTGNGNLVCLGQRVIVEFAVGNSDVGACRPVSTRKLKKQTRLDGFGVCRNHLVSVTSSPTPFQQLWTATRRPLTRRSWGPHLIARGEQVRARGRHPVHAAFRRPQLCIVASKQP